MQAQATDFSIARKSRQQIFQLLELWDELKNELQNKQARQRLILPELFIFIATVIGELRLCGLLIM